MSIGNAQTFIRTVQTDKDLRKALNQAPDGEARQAVLAEHGLTFTAPEFGDGFRSLLIQCQTEDAADEIRQIKLWWEMLQAT